MCGGLLEKTVFFVVRTVHVCVLGFVPDACDTVGRRYVATSKKTCKFIGFLIICSKNT